MLRNVFISVWFVLVLSVCQGADGTLPYGLSDRLYSLRRFWLSDTVRPTSLVPSGDGGFYGTTEAVNNTSGGTIFKISQVGRPNFITTNGNVVIGIPPGSLPLVPHSFDYTYTPLYSFQSATGGKQPTGPLVVADGFIYGVTRAGGTHGAGIVFRLTPEGTLTTLHSFGPTEGALPYRLIRHSDGNFYGTLSMAAVEGFTGGQKQVVGGNDYSIDQAIFRMTPEGEVTVIARIQRSFPDVRPPLGVSTSNEFSTPEIVEGNDGALYVTAAISLLEPVILKFDTSGEKLAMFTGTSGAANLLRGKDGNIYASQDSSIIRVSSTGEVTQVGGFTQRTVEISSLTEAANGMFYGAAVERVPGSLSQTREFLFRVRPDRGLEIQALLSGLLDRSPTALVQGTDGVVYGAFRTYRSSTLVLGSIFAYFPVADSLGNRPPRTGTDHAGPGLPALSHYPADTTIFEKLDVLSNDFDPEDGPLKIRSVSDSRVQINEDQTLTFRMGPNGGSLPVYLNYIVEDSLGNTSEGTVAFNNRAPVAVTDSPKVTVTRTPTGGYASALFNPVANDTDSEGDELRIVSVSDPRVSFSASNVMHYGEVADLGTELLASFTYTITDGKGGFATGTVRLRNQAPIAKDDLLARTWSGTTSYYAVVLANDSDPDGDPLTVTEATSNTGDPVLIGAGGSLVVTPSTIPEEGIKIYYTVTDGLGGTASATATAPPSLVINQRPKASDDRFVVAGGGDVLLDVLANDIDPDMDPLVITGVSDGGKGTVTFSPDYRALVYRPNAASANPEILMYTISDGRGATSSASVKVFRPFKKARGTYHTLIGAPHGLGALQMRVSNTGQVTGTLQFDGRRFPWRGSFDQQGNLTVVFNRATKRALELTFVLDPKLERITALLTDDEREVSFEMERSTKVPRYDLAGYYTVALPAGPDQPQLPKGYGYAIMRVRASGAVAVSGKLGDGTPISASSQLRVNGEVALYARAYRRSEWNAGGLTGSGFLTRRTAGTEFNGTFRWIKLPNPASRFDRGGFTGQVTAKGSRYSGPSGNNANTLFSSLRLKLELEDGNLPDDLTKNVRLQADGRATVSPIADDQLSIWVNPTTGLIWGRFIHPESGKPTTISGVMIPAQERGYGLFRGINESGSMRIRPD